MSNKNSKRKCLINISSGVKWRMLASYSIIFVCICCSVATQTIEWISNLLTSHNELIIILYYLLLNLINHQGNNLWSNFKSATQSII